ncbi:MAG: hypothetical protein D6711_00685 [Chloroflexi bacterium]|nr:MAG: hypothetical protein D6711_00685 [Chloroflexota bacterium]
MNDLPDFDETAFWLEPDTVLTDIVISLVNVMGMPIGVTLFIKGMVISGVLVSENEYLTSLTDTFRSLIHTNVDNQEFANQVDELLDFTPMAETSLELENDPDDDSQDPMLIPAPVRYLHLRDALILSPYPAMGFSQSILPIMRIKLTAVDGWLLGQAAGVEDEPNGDKPILH